uniref:Uncharacterized protein n=1 Tax=Minutocellus polymorphus TaxID=265543 RepID=A0A7S0AE34_9STRA
MCSGGACSEKTSDIGEECATDSDCESGVCGSGGSCEESRTDGGDDAPTAAASPTASPPTSVPTSTPTSEVVETAAPTMVIASPETDETANKGAVGATCEENGDCESNLCADSLCSEALKANGEPCEADSECQSDVCGTAGVCDNVSNDTEATPVPAPSPSGDDDDDSEPAPVPAPSGGGDNGGNNPGDPSRPSRPNEVESYSGDLSIPYNFQISNGGEELTPEDIADIEEALGILSQQLAEEDFPDGGSRRLRLRLRRAFKVSGSSRHLLVVYNENDPAKVKDAQQAECLLSTDPSPCYDMDAETTLTLVDEDRGVVREEFRDSMEDAIADGLLTQILREINPETTLVATAEPSDGQENKVDESREPEEGEDVTARSTALSPGGIAGIAILAGGVTAAVAFALIASRRRNSDDDPLDSSDDESPDNNTSTGLHEDSSIRRLRAAAAAASSAQQPGVYPDTYHSDAASMRASSRAINPGLEEDEYLSSDDEEPTGAPGSFPTEAPPTPPDNASTPLIPAAAAAGGAALAAQYRGIVDESSTDQSMQEEDDAQLQDSYDEALDAQIMSAAGKLDEDADVDEIMSALPGLPAGAEKNSESPNSSFEDDIRAAISSMEGADNGRDVSPERELPDALYSSASEPESEKEEDKKKPSGVAGLIKRLSSQNMVGET